MFKKPRCSTWNIRGTYLPRTKNPDVPRGTSQAEITGLLGAAYYVQKTEMFHVEHSVSAGLSKRSTMLEMHHGSGAPHCF